MRACCVTPVDVHACGSVATQYPTLRALIDAHKSTYRHAAADRSKPARTAAIKPGDNEHTYNGIDLRLCD
jgi:hypothetical protein